MRHEILSNVSALEFSFWKKFEQKNRIFRTSFKRKNDEKRFLTCFGLMCRIFLLQDKYIIYCCIPIDRELNKLQNYIFSKPKRHWPLGKYQYKLPVKHHFFSIFRFFSSFEIFLYLKLEWTLFFGLTHSIDLFKATKLDSFGYGLV